MASTLTVAAKGQITPRKDVLRHLGGGPGEKIEVDLLPNGRAQLRRTTKAGPSRTSSAVPANPERSF